MENRQKMLFRATITLATITLTTITSILCFVIGEKYFFDKLYYKKSFIHGYISKWNQDIPWLFGRRSTDLYYIDKKQPKSSVYSILLIGDSFVWGAGIRNNQRFASILEKKLNKIRPTKVISLAKSGWNIVEYSHIYQKSTTNLDPSLVIFSLVHNDVFTNPDSSSDLITTQCQKQYPQSPHSSAYDYLDIIEKAQKGDDVGKSFSDISKDGWTNPTNLCILDGHLNKLPSEKAVYFITDNYDPSDYAYSTYISHLTSHSKHIINSNISRFNPKYSDNWNGNPYSHFNVSQMEGHPNAKANQMFADVLYQEIVTNPKFDFIIK